MAANPTERGVLQAVETFKISIAAGIKYLHARTCSRFGIPQSLGLRSNILDARILGLETAGSLPSDR